MRIVLPKTIISRAPSSGFTLIELAIVIVILGVLSAFALPRFADLSGDARTAKKEGAYSGMRSAASIVAMACRVDVACNPLEDPAGGGTGNAIVVEGATITLSFGYPRRTRAGQIEHIGSAPGFVHASAVVALRDLLFPLGRSQFQCPFMFLRYPGSHHACERLNCFSTAVS